MRREENIESLLGSMGTRAKKAGLVEDYLPQKRLSIYLSRVLANIIFSRIENGFEPDIANPDACLDMLKPIIISDNGQILYIASID